MGVYQFFFLPLPWSCLRRRSHWLQSIGVSERAQVVEMIIMIVTIHPSWRKSTPVIPVTRVSGKNTAIRVSVEAITEMATSLVPCTAA